MKKELYTAGEIARIAGVSLRTIRYYDTKGLLPPVSRSESGYRCYDKSSIVLLQRILMLKYLGFSLEQYRNPENLNRRINIHNYSTSPQGWMEWVYEHLNIQPRETVLELGCGTGLLWMERTHLLEGLRLILTDVPPWGIPT